MCLSFVALNQIPDAPLVLLFNRDEDLDRAAAPAHYWPETKPWIFGGKDLLKGGTWAGVNERGLFGMLLFVREPRQPVTPTAFRGELVPNFLRANADPESFLGELDRRAGDYLGFNLIVGSSSSVFHYSNKTRLITELEPGVHGCSNADLNDPWFKVVRGKERLAEQLASAPLDVERYLALMNDNEEAAPDAVQHTGLSFDYERVRSPLFIRTKNYGTRTSTAVIFYSGGELDFVERTYANDAAQFDTVRMRVKL